MRSSSSPEGPAAAGIPYRGAVSSGRQQQIRWRRAQQQIRWRRARHHSFTAIPGTSATSSTPGPIPPPPAFAHSPRPVQQRSQLEDAGSLPGPSTAGGHWRGRRSPPQIQPEEARPASPSGPSTDSVHSPILPEEESEEWPETPALPSPSFSMVTSGSSTPTSSLTYSPGLADPARPVLLRRIRQLLSIANRLFYRIVDNF
ncbi:uncharacterized protein LOC134932071 isoform X1 [Pseudophryne corroboree]|uniref:uncharacterized protein LOC134932071 isoform X1 n=1 Tax=Pseudophryne corroboree TaxID=495146 RepID=UPI003081EB99